MTQLPNKLFSGSLAQAQFDTEVVLLWPEEVAESGGKKTMR